MNYNYAPLIQPAAVVDVVQCCVEQNVTSSCMDACSLMLDIDSVIDRPECVGDFHKLMRCAAGSEIFFKEKKILVACLMQALFDVQMDPIIVLVVPNGAFLDVAWIGVVVNQ